MVLTFEHHFKRVFYHCYIRIFWGNSTEHGIVFRTNHDLVLKISVKKCYTANAVSLLENRHFWSRRPHVFVASFKIVTIKKNATLQTLFPYWKIAIFGRIAPRIRRIVPS